MGAPGRRSRARPARLLPRTGPPFPPQVTGVHRFDGGFVVLSGDRVRVRTKALQDSRRRDGRRAHRAGRARGEAAAPHGREADDVLRRGPRLRRRHPDGARAPRRPRRQAARAPARAARRRAPAGRLRRRARDARALSPAPPRRPALRGRGDGPLRRRHAARRHRLPQGEPHEARRQRLARRVRDGGTGAGRLPPAPPRCRARRGRPHPPGPRARQPRWAGVQGLHDLVRAERPEHPCRACTPSGARRRDGTRAGCSTAPTSRTPRDRERTARSTATSSSRSGTPATAASAFPSPTRARSSTGSASVSGSTCITNLRRLLMLRRASVLLAVPIAVLAAASPAAAKGPVLELAGAQPFAGQRVLLPAASSRCARRRRGRSPARPS